MAADETPAPRGLKALLAGNPAVRAAYDATFPYAAFAMAIVRLRARLGLTQEQLAALAGTTQSAIARAENGKHPVSSPFLRRLAQATNSRIEVSLDDAGR